MDRLTDREWKVMEALWQGGPQTLGEVLAGCGGHRLEPHHGTHLFDPGDGQWTL